MRHSSVELSLGFLLLLATLAPCAAQEISEFMASNNGTLLDGNGNDSDWIEVHNPTAAAIDLSGWFLTDAGSNLEKWPFPDAIVLGPGEYYLVFASSRDEPDYVDPVGFLHTNFALSTGGEYLALVMPDGITVVSDYSPEYPPQSADVSYGRLEGAAQFFTTPTPGAPNQANSTPSPRFSRPGGLITEPFNLELSVDSADVEMAVTEIRFTLDGSRPTEESERYSVRTRFCELFYNFDDGVVSMDDYAGVYVFMEKIKRDKNRVNITRLTPADNSEPEITGGYIVKVDAPDRGETVFRTPRNANPEGWIIAEPKPETITPEQRAWIKKYLNDFETVLFSPNFTDPVLGYADWVDVEGLIDYFLFTDMVKNADGFFLSIYYQKERGEKLTMAAIWDFNVCLGNDTDWSTWKPEGWLHEASGSFWYPRLFRDPAAVEARRERWNEWRREFFPTDRLLADIDETAAFLDEAQKRNFERWDILGRRVQPGQVNPPGFQERDT